jgi:hypothetical protein
MQKLARDFYAESLRLNDEAMRVMKANGLKIIEISNAEKATWRTVMASGHDLLIGEGKAIPAAVYTDLIDDLKNFRK